MLIRTLLCLALFGVGYSIAKFVRPGSSPPSVEAGSRSREALLAEAWGSRWSEIRVEALRSGTWAEDWLDGSPSLAEGRSWSNAFPIVHEALLEATTVDNEVSILTELHRSSLDSTGPFYWDRLYNPAGVEFDEQQLLILEQAESESAAALRPLAEEAAALFREALESRLADNRFDRWLDEEGLYRVTSLEDELHLRGACRRTFRGIGGGWQVAVVVDTAYFPELDETMRRLQAACGAREERLRAAVRDVTARTSPR